MALGHALNSNTAADQPPCGYSSTEKKETHHPDRLGTKVVTNVDSGGSFEQSTLPFGTAFGAESSGYSNQVFTSYDRSGVTGLDYANNRTYSSGQGRFMQVDPIGMSAATIGDPQRILWIRAG